MIAAAASTTGGRDGLRTVDARRDMAPLAVLLRLSFASKLDAAGRRMVDAMQMFGRAGWLGWLAGHLVLPPAAYPQGFVWEAGGRLVGNASMLEVTGSPGRWVVANVAVHPDARRQGIATALVKACMEQARAQRGHEVVLQVDSDNRGARHLYTGLGFEDLATRTRWVRDGYGDEGTRVGSPIRLRQPGEWSLQYALARRTFPEGLIWPHPLRSSFFRTTTWMERLDRGGRRHWVWMKGERLLASLSARWGVESGRWRFVLVVDPGSAGQVEAEMLRYGFAALGRRRPLIVLDYPKGDTDSIFRALRFRPQRTLTWMRAALA